MRYVAEYHSRARGRLAAFESEPKREQWDSLIIKARIENTVLSRIAFDDTPHDPTIRDLACSIVDNRLTVALESVIGWRKLYSIAFLICYRHSGAASEWLRVDFETPIKLPAGEEIRLTFLAPYESQRPRIYGDRPYRLGGLGGEIESAEYLDT